MIAELLNEWTAFQAAMTSGMIFRSQVQSLGEATSTLNIVPACAIGYSYNARLELDGCAVPIVSNRLLYPSNAELTVPKTPLG